MRKYRKHLPVAGTAELIKLKGEPRVFASIWRRPSFTASRGRCHVGGPNLAKGGTRNRYVPPFRLAPLRVEIMCSRSSRNYLQTKLCVSFVCQFISARRKKKSRA